MKVKPPTVLHLDLEVSMQLVTWLEKAMDLVN